MSTAVTLTIAGDSTGAQAAFDRAAQSADDMAKKIDTSVGSTKRPFADMEERTDSLASKTGIAASGVSGLGDAFELFGKDAPGFLQPVALGFGAISAAMDLATVAQSALNATWLASPITWIIVGIVALIAIFVLLWNKCDWFRNFWKGMWEGIKSAASTVWDWLSDLPDKIKTAFSKIGDFISAPFKAGFDAVKRFWNNTIGGKGFDLPSWVPFGLGGKSFRFPKFHDGGIVPGAPGQEVMAVLQAGERVTPAGRSGSGQVVQINLTAGDVDALIAQRVQRYVARNGGKVQLALGR